MKWYEPKTLFKFARFVYDSFTYNKGVENAKSLTYTSLFAVVPLLTLLVAMLSAFPSFQVYTSQIQDMVFTRLLPSSSSQLEEYLDRFTGQARNLTWVGGLILLATSYLMLVNIERVFNSIWGVGETRKGLSSFLLYWSVLSLGPILLGVGIGISSYITSLSLFEALTEVSGSVGVNNLLLRIFPLVFTSLGFTLLYVAVPNCGVSLKHGLVGGVVVALTFTLVKKIFTWFISVASFQFIYGAFAAIPIFLLWIYICWTVILVGANLVRAIPLFQTEHYIQDVHPTLLMLALLHNFWMKQQQGEGINVSELGEQHWPFTGMQLDQFLALLTGKRIIKACDESEYVLSRDMKTLPLSEILSWFPWQPPVRKDFEQPMPAIVEQHIPNLSEFRKKFEEIEDLGRQLFSDDLDTLFRRQMDKEPPVEGTVAHFRS